jgi:fermentation-respiration switch protein FrsA (DUF1100 family)
LIRFASFVAVGYVGIVTMLLFLENRLIYHPSQNWAPPPNSNFHDVSLPMPDGTHIHAWWSPVKGCDEALLYCHGNAGNLSHRGPTVAEINKHLGMSVLIIDYPGFGKSEGAPSEEGCYQAADAGYTWLTDTKHIAPNKIILHGHSLGGGVVTDLASRKDHRALVLVKTFTSLPDVAADLYWWLPMPTHWLMCNQMDSASKLGKIHRPVFVAHGTNDRMIPHAHGERLFAAANQPKRLLSMQGVDHNDSLPSEFFISLREFLKANPAE